ncbi:MAG: HD domain-containing protein [Romboutsia sp.]|nr:HD domain-containing protein [Romboutsia sp.]
MTPKRIKQFYINATDLMKNEDYDYVKRKLNNEEYKLFNKILKSEQKHSVRIAKEIEFIIDNNLIDDIDIIENKNLLIKAALLHDIGKSKQKVNIIEKSIIVILNKLTKGRLKKIQKSKKIQCYYNHSEYSYNLLKDIIEDDLILNIIKNHHNNTDNKYINFFKQIDDNN